LRQRLQRAEELAGADSTIGSPLTGIRAAILRAFVDIALRHELGRPHGMRDIRSDIGDDGCAEPLAKARGRKSGPRFLRTFEGILSSPDLDLRLRPSEIMSKNNKQPTLDLLNIAIETWS